MVQLQLKVKNVINIKTKMFFLLEMLSPTSLLFVLFLISFLFDQIKRFPNLLIGIEYNIRNESSTTSFNYWRLHCNFSIWLKTKYSVGRRIPKVKLVILLFSNFLTKFGFTDPLQIVLLMTILDINQKECFLSDYNILIYQDF